MQVEFTSQNINLGAIKIGVLYEEGPYYWLFITFFTIYKTGQQIFTFRFVIFGAYALVFLDLCNHANRLLNTTQ